MDKERNQMCELLFLNVEGKEREGVPQRQICSLLSVSPQRGISVDVGPFSVEQLLWEEQ